MELEKNIKNLGDVLVIYDRHDALLYLDEYEVENAKYPIYAMYNHEKGWWERTTRGLALACLRNQRNEAVRNHQEFLELTEGLG